MRGKEPLERRGQGWLRITPAYAGKSVSYEKLPSVNKDHPRLCGEKDNTFYCKQSQQGSPPPMRGKGVSVQVQDAPYRITPAYAGKSKKYVTTFQL